MCKIIPFPTPRPSRYMNVLSTHDFLKWTIEQLYLMGDIPQQEYNRLQEKMGK